MEKPVRGAIPAVILAAGRSRRMGQEKLLLPYGGRPLICAALEAALLSESAPVICVVRESSEVPGRVWAEKGLFCKIHWAVNREADLGRASSLLSGIEALPKECPAALFLPGDVPGLTPEDLDAVIARFWRTQAMAVATVEADGTPSHPVLFSRDLFPELLALRGDIGARGILTQLGDAVERVARSGTPLADVDTPEDYRRLVGPSA